MTASDRLRIATRTLEDAGAFPSDACGVLHPPESAPAGTGEVEARWVARTVVEDLALALQASLLVRHAPAPMADAFCAGRLGDGRGRAFGALPRGIDGRAIVARVVPA